MMAENQSAHFWYALESIHNLIHSKFKRATVTADQMMLLYSRQYGIICNTQTCVRGEIFSQQAYCKQHRNVPCLFISVEVASNTYRKKQ